MNNQIFDIIALTKPPTDNFNQIQNKENDNAVKESNHSEKSRINSMNFNMTSNEDRETDNIYCMTSQIDGKTVSFNDIQKHAIMGDQSDKFHSSSEPYENT